MKVENPSVVQFEPDAKARKLKYGRIWRKLNPEKVRLSAKRGRVKLKYGITIEERDAILLSQGNRCKICRTDDPGKRGWFVDHCHKTDHVRGILCINCNTALGHVKDTPAILKAMIRYLYDA